MLGQARLQTAQVAGEVAQVEQHLLDLFLHPMAVASAEEERKVRQSQAPEAQADFKEIQEQQHQLWVAQELGEFPHLQEQLALAQMEAELLAEELQLRQPILLAVLEADFCH